MNKEATIKVEIEQFPDGTVAGALAVTLLNASGETIDSHSVPSESVVDGMVVTFDVPTGTGFTVSVQRFAASDQPLGAPAVSAPFDVTEPTTVSIAIPVAVTVA